MSRTDRFADVTGAVLLGGGSERMGRDKAQVPIAGVPSATRLARLLDGFCAEVLLVGGDAPKGAPGRRVADPPGPRCALRGLVAALDAARSEQVLVVATDLFALELPPLLALLAWPQADAVIPFAEDAPREPLCTLYRREAVLPRARERLARGALSIQGLLDELDVSVLGGADFAAVARGGLALASANTPEELARLEQRIAEAS